MSSLLHVRARVPLQVQGTTAPGRKIVMNLLLLPDKCTSVDLSQDDPRFTHLTEVLRVAHNDEIDVGVINGPRGKGIVSMLPCGGIRLDLSWRDGNDLAVLPVELLIGLPRPQAARRILREMTCLGVRRICFFRSDKGESTYRDSRLWQTAEWERQCREGAEQSFHTYVPEVFHFESLAACLDSLQRDIRLALDIYESTDSLDRAVRKSRRLPDNGVISLAVGSERGWGEQERHILRDSRFTLVHLGPRVMRTETAAIAAVSIVASLTGCLDKPFDRLAD